MTECIWCDEVYDGVGHDTCPNCAVSTDTKGIKIISLEDESE